MVSSVRLGTSRSGCVAASMSILLATLCAASVLVQANDMAPPIAEGTHTFVVRLAEHPKMTGGHLDAEVRGRYIRLTAKPNSSIFPAGLVDEGTLLWHAASKQWIIGHEDADAKAEEVGGCTNGPLVVDLERKILWMC